MPIYEYKCNDCNKVFEELVSSDPGKLLPCPNCSSENTKKLMSAAGISSGSSKMPECASTCASPQSCCAGGTCPMH